MKVSEFLKKVAHISGAGIRIEFKADKLDEKPDVESLNEYTPEESADQIIKRAAEYTLQEVVVMNNTVFITAVRAAKRTPKPKPEKNQDEKREEQKQAIAEELERLDQAVAVLIETIVAPFRRIGHRENGKRGGIHGKETIWKNEYDVFAWWMEEKEIEGQMNLENFYEYENEY